MEQDTTVRNKRKSRRIKTLFKKAKELQEISGCEVFVLIRDNFYNKTMFGGTPELRNSFVHGTLHSSLPKYKEVDITVKHPSQVNHGHLRSIWPGNNERSSAGCTSTTGSNDESNIVPLVISNINEQEFEPDLPVVPNPQQHEEILMNGQLDGMHTAETEAQGKEVCMHEVIESSDPACHQIQDKEVVTNEVHEDSDTEEPLSTPKDDVATTSHTPKTVKEPVASELTSDDEDDEEPLSLLQNIVGGGQSSDKEQPIEQMDDDTENSAVYTVAKVKKRRVFEGTVQYLVKWKGWGEKYNTWEPEDHILDKRLLSEFNKKHQL